MCDAEGAHESRPLLVNLLTLKQQQDHSLHLQCTASTITLMRNCAPSFQLCACPQRHEITRVIQISEDFAGETPLTDCPAIKWILKSFWNDDTGPHLAVGEWAAGHRDWPSRVLRRAASQPPPASRWSVCSPSRRRAAATAGAAPPAPSRAPPASAPPCAAHAAPTRAARVSHTATRSYTQLHAAHAAPTRAARVSHTQLHAATRSYTQLHAATRSYTHAATRSARRTYKGSTRLTHTATRSYTQLH